MLPLLGDHYVRGLDDRDRLVADREAQFVDSLVGDRGGHDHPAADVDPHMRRGGTALDTDDLALELIARTKFRASPGKRASGNGAARRPGGSRHRARAIGTAGEIGPLHRVV